MIEIEEIEHDKYVYDIQVKDNENFFANDLLVHNCYFVMEPIVEKKYGKDKSKWPDDKTIAIFLDKFNKKALNPAIDWNIQRNLDLLNGFTNVMGCDREVIASKALVTGISRYTMRVIDDEGKLLEKPKQKTIGMPNINMTIPKHVRGGLDDVVSIIFDKENKDFTKYINKFKKNFKKMNPSDISLKTGMNNIDGENHYVAKASRVHNIVVDRLGIEDEFEHIKNGDKVMILYLKNNPITPAETIAYLEDKFLYKTGLDKYIDYNKHLEKNFTNNVQEFAKIIDWQMNGSTLAMANYF